MMKRGFDRMERISDSVQKALANILRDDRDEHGFHLITITSVQIARDLSHAKIYVTLLTDDQDEIKRTLLSLNRAAKRFRYRLAQTVKLRIVPVLKFFYDDTTTHGFHIASLIDDAFKKIAD